MSNKLIKAHKEIQAELDKGVIEFKKLYSAKLKESGISDILFLTTNKEAIQMLAEYQQVKNDAESQGFTMPDFDRKMKITFHDEVKK